MKDAKMRLSRFGILIALLLVFVIKQKGDAFTQGLNTTWNGNLLGGGWVCFQTQITGCSQGFNAVCDGVNDDKTAWNNFLTYASGVSDAKLYVPPGATCRNSTGFFTTILGANSHVDGTQVPKVTIWAYGASFDTLWLGGTNCIFPDNTHNALLQNANAGDSTVTLVNSGDASIFAIGKWIVVSGLSMQNSDSYPPNWFTFEYHKITNISGSVITLDAPLSYSYKSTWPQADPGSSGSINLGGPASAYVLNVIWDQDLTIYGLRIKQTSNAVFSSARSITLINIILDSPDGIAPSVAQTYNVFNSNIQSPEFDKVVDTLLLQNVTGAQFIWQSASFNHVTMSNISLTSAAGMNGTPRNAIIDHLTTPTVRMGPIAFGHGTSFAISNSTVGTTVGFNICLPPSNVTFSSGTFIMAKSSSAGNISGLFAWAIPGQEYYFGDSDGTNNSIPHTQFKVTDFWEDASNYYVDTDIGSVLPSPTCNGHGCPCYTAYQASSVTQTNTGRADMTPFAP